MEDSDGQNLAGDRDFDIRALEGDVNGGRSSASGGLDSGGVLSHLGEAVGMDNAQYDVNTSGDIDPLDVGAVSGRFGHSAS